MVEADATVALQYVFSLGAGGDDTIGGVTSAEGLVVAQVQARGRYDGDSPSCDGGPLHLGPAVEYGTLNVEQAPSDIF